MSINASYALVLSFIFLAAVLCWTTITSTTKKTYKLFLIPLLIWYGLVLIYAPNGLAGWPKYQEPPDNSLILYVHVVEPDSKNEGGFYFWVINPNEQDKQEFSLNPAKFLEKKFKETPKSYKMKFDKKLYEEWLAASKKSRKEKGLIFYKKKGFNNNGIKEEKDSEGRFKILSSKDLPIKQIEENNDSI